MSDMLAVLLGGGGSAASQAIAALAGGKLNAKGAHAQGGGEDPFMAVLFDRMNLIQGKAGQPVEASALIQLPAAEMDTAGGEPSQFEGMGVLAAGQEIPVSTGKPALKPAMKPLEAALLHANPSPADAAFQAALAAPFAPGPHVAPPTVDEATTAQMEAADVPAGSPLSEVLADKGVQRAAVAKPTLAAHAAPAASAPQFVANAKPGAAEAAADGQLLPQGRGREQPDLPMQQSRADASLAPSVSSSQSASTSFQNSVAQSLAAQTPGTTVDMQAGTTGNSQQTQAVALGIGQSMAAGVDAQGRSAAGSVHMSIEVPVLPPSPM